MLQLSSRLVSRSFHTSSPSTFFNQKASGSSSSLAFQRYSVRHHEGLLREVLQGAAVCQLYRPYHWWFLYFCILLLSFLVVSELVYWFRRHSAQPSWAWRQRWVWNSKLKAQTYKLNNLCGLATHTHTHIPWLRFEDLNPNERREGKETKCYIQNVPEHSFGIVWVDSVTLFDCWELSSCCRWIWRNQYGRMGGCPVIEISSSKMTTWVKFSDSQLSKGSTFIAFQRSTEPAYERNKSLFCHGMHLNKRCIHKIRQFVQMWAWADACTRRQYVYKKVFIARTAVCNSILITWPSSIQQKTICIHL